MKRKVFLFVGIPSKTNINGGSKTESSELKDGIALAAFLIVYYESWSNNQRGQYRKTPNQNKGKAIAGWK
jgi:hypothetical protein